MNTIVDKGLHHWQLSGADYTLVAARENQVFKVTFKGQSYAFRIHRPGYHSRSELNSELLWMKALASGGLSVPDPIPSKDGTFLHTVDGVEIDLLSWMDGTQMGATGRELEITDRVGFFTSLGREIAHMHEISDAWDTPANFSRKSWNREGLLGENPVWDRFWENPTLSASDRDLFRTAREIAVKELLSIESRLDYGLIHADIVRENVLIRSNGISIIDFDDSGYGFRLFDLATTLFKNLEEANYPALSDALFSGYRTVRAIDTSKLDFFILIRALTYVGWIIKRLDETDAMTRNARFIDTARVLARQYVDQKQSSPEAK